MSIGEQIMKELQTNSLCVVNKLQILKNLKLFKIVAYNKIITFLFDYKNLRN